MTRFLRLLALLMVAASISLFGGCASVYVDGNSPEVPAAEFRKPAAPTDVQLVWEFQTRGAANPRATEMLKARVRDQVAASGLFSAVTDAPATSGALLSITVNNVPLSDDAASKGFVAGLTFGLAGQTVADGYDGTLRYSPAAGNAPIERKGKHVIYANIGNAPPPPNTTKAENFEVAVTRMLREMLSRLLGDLSKAPEFK